MLSRARDVADDLVQATCLRAIERADQFVQGTRVDRWLFAILRSIWLNDIRSQRIREGGGFVDAEEVLTLDGAREIETNIAASEVLRAINRLPEAQRETILLVYGEGQGDTAMVFVSITGLTVIGILAYAAVVWLERRALHYLPRASMRTA